MRYVQKRYTKPTRIKRHKRTTKSGKRVTVKPYTRKIKRVQYGFKIRKNMTNRQYRNMIAKQKRVMSRDLPSSDADGDRVRNWDDCRPYDPNKQDDNICYRCGGKVKYYDGAMGYESMRCQKCGHDYAETSKEEYNKNKRNWEKDWNIIQKNGWKQTNNGPAYTWVTPENKNGDYALVDVRPTGDKYKGWNFSAHPMGGMEVSINYDVLSEAMNSAVAWMKNFKTRQDTYENKVIDKFRGQVDYIKTKQNKSTGEESALVRKNGKWFIVYGTHDVGEYGANEKEAREDF